MSSLLIPFHRVHEGSTVTFRPRGGSMTGLVEDGAEVVVTPCDPHRLEVGDVVLVRVHGSVYLHKVIGTDPARQRVQIGNNRGGVNGWTRFGNVAGICTHVEGRPRPRAAVKIQAGSR